MCTKTYLLIILQFSDLSDACCFSASFYTVASDYINICNCWWDQSPGIVVDAACGFQFCYPSCYATIFSLVSLSESKGNLHRNILIDCPTHLIS